MRDHRVGGIKDAEQGFPHGELRKEVDLIDGLPAHFTVDEDVPAASLNLLVKKPQKKTCLSAARPSKDDQVFQIVVGQYLEILRLRAFELEKQGDFYIVRSELLTEAHERILKNHLAEQGESTHLTAGDGWLSYGPLGTARLNAQELEKRGNHGFEQTDKLAQLLSTVGGDLDSKKATAFKILWAPDSVSVEYETPTGVRERREFTVKKLQQLAFYSERG